MVRKIKLTVYCYLLFILFFSGIYRHDVNVQAYLDLGKEPQFQCVGQVFITNEPGASCVLIQERFVLTAAHILVKGETKAETVVYDGIEAVTYTEDESGVLHPEVLSVKIGDKQIAVKGILLHSYYLQDQTKGVCDIAILELAEPVIGIAFPKLNDNTDELNADVIGVGYGASGPANRPDLVALKNKKIAGQNVIDSIGGVELNGLKTLLFADFDHPTDTACCNRIGSSIPKPLEFMTTGGDSGGGLFRKKNNEWELIGITSGGGIELEQFMKSFYYGQIGSYTRVAAIYDWINENIK